MFPAQRFTSFSTSTNLGITTVQGLRDSSVLNTVSNQLKSVTSGMTDMANSLMQKVGISPSDLNASVDEGIRAVRDTFSTLRDVSKLTPSALEGEIASMLTDSPQLQSVFRNIAATCRDSAMSKTPGFKPFNDNINCGNAGNGKCSTGQVRGALDKLLGGALGAITRTLQAALKALMTLANLGYSGGLCGIFAKIVNGLGSPGSVIQRAAAGLIAGQGSNGNVSSVLDIASGMGNSIPSKEIPGLVGMVADNFTIPSNFKSGSLGNLYEGATDAYSAIQPNYDVNSRGMSTLANLGKNLSNSSFTAAAKEYVSSSVIENFSSPIVKTGASLAIGYASNKVSDVFSSGIGFKI